MKQAEVNQEQSDILTSQSVGEKTHNKNSPLIERENIPNTPFTIITRWQGNEIQIAEHFLVFGDYRITDPTPTKEKTIQKLETEKWLIMTNVMIIINERAKEYDKLKQAEKEYDMPTIPFPDTDKKTGENTTD